MDNPNLENDECNVTYENSPDVVTMTPNGPRATLPSGRVTPEQYSRFYRLRRQEIVSATRRALDKAAADLSDEEVFCFWSSKVAEGDVAARAA